jgi:hypothetical protein
MPTNATASTQDKSAAIGDWSATHIWGPLVTHSHNAWQRIKNTEAGERLARTWDNVKAKYEGVRKSYGKTFIGRQITPRTMLRTIAVFGIMGYVPLGRTILSYLPTGFKTAFSFIPSIRAILLIGISGFVLVKKDAVSKIWSDIKNGVVNTAQSTRDYYFTNPEQMVIPFGSIFAYLTMPYYLSWIAIFGLYRVSLEDKIGAHPTATDTETFTYTIEGTGEIKELTLKNMISKEFTDGFHGQLFPDIAPATTTPNTALPKPVQPKITNITFGQTTIALPHGEEETIEGKFGRLTILATGEYYFKLKSSVLKELLKRFYDLFANLAISKAAFDKQAKMVAMGFVLLAIVPLCYNFGAGVVVTPLLYAAKAGMIFLGGYAIWNDLGYLSRNFIKVFTAHSGKITGMLLGLLWKLKPNGWFTFEPTPYLHPVVEHAHSVLDFLFVNEIINMHGKYSGNFGSTGYQLFQGMFFGGMVGWAIEKACDYAYDTAFSETKKAKTLSVKEFGQFINDNKYRIGIAIAGTFLFIASPPGLAIGASLGVSGLEYAAGSFLLLNLGIDAYYGITAFFKQWKVNILKAKTEQAAKVAGVAAPTPSVPGLTPPTPALTGSVVPAAVVGAPVLPAFHGASAPVGPATAAAPASAPLSGKTLLELSLARAKQLEEARKQGQAAANDPAATAALAKP